MIKKVGEEWRSVGRNIRDLESGGSEDVKQVLDQIAGVQTVLKRMCQVSVTRRSLRDAVRAALLPVIHEHKDELFPELVELRRRLAADPSGVPGAALTQAVAPLAEAPVSEPPPPAAVPETVRERLDDFERRIHRLATVEMEMHSSVEDLSSRATEVDGRLENVDGQLETVDGQLKNVDGQLETVDGQLKNVDGRLESVDGQLEGVDGRLGSADARLDEVSEQLRQLGETIAGSDAKHGAKHDAAEARIAGVEERAEKFDIHLLELDETTEKADARLQASETQLERLDKERARQVERFDAQLHDVETRLRELDGGLGALGGRLDDVEVELRKELENTVNALTDKLSELREVLTRLEEGMPARESIEAVGKRLGDIEGQLEKRFGRVSKEVEEVSGQVDRVSRDVEKIDGRVERVSKDVDRVSDGISKVSDGVEHLDALTPDIRGLAARFTEVRHGLEAVAGRVGESDRTVRHFREAIGDRLGDLQALLRDGIARWEDDQSHTVERVSVMRDTLRDQLHQISAQVETAQTSLIGKVMGREPGLKLNHDEWEQLSGKIESIVSGLEAVLAKKRTSQS